MLPGRRRGPLQDETYETYGAWSMQVSLWNPIRFGPRLKIKFLGIASPFAMGKHSKRLRKDKSARERIPLGETAPFDDDIDKDDEERKLESLLFGKPSVARRERATVGEEDLSESDNDVEMNSAELEGLLDSDVSHGW
jgi:hypothetical protein